VPVLWALFAFFAAGSTPGYVTVGQMFPREQMGRVSTAANTLTLVGAFVLQAVIGAMLDLWPRTANGGWDPRGYSAALALSIATQIIVAARQVEISLMESSLVEAAGIEPASVSPTQSGLHA